MNKPEPFSTSKTYKIFCPFSRSWGDPQWSSKGFFSFNLESSAAKLTVDNQIWKKIINSLWAQILERVNVNPVGPFKHFLQEKQTNNQKKKTTIWETFPLHYIIQYNKPGNSHTAFKYLKSFSSICYIKINLTFQSYCLVPCIT